MFIILYEHKLLTGIILFFLLSSIICQIAAGVIYQNMISQTDNMSDTKNKTLNQCKEKYAGYYKLNGKMVNTDVFVDRFLQGICLLKIHLSHLPHISGQFMMLSVLVTGISVCFSLAADQYSGIISVFFNFRNCGYTGKKTDIKDKFNRLSGKSLRPQAGDGKGKCHGGRDKEEGKICKGIV